MVLNIYAGDIKVVLISSYPPLFVAELRAGDLEESS